MYATDIMVEEHANISRMLRVIKNMCCSILDGAAVDTKDFTDIIDFVRNYADVHHHQKEEHTLFPEMVEHMGPFSDRELSDGIKEKINAEVRRLFDENEKNGINEKYLTMLTGLEAKYNPLGYVSAPAE